MEGDSSTITAYIATQSGRALQVVASEFASLAVNSISEIGHIEDIEALEFNSLIAVEEKPCVGVDLYNYTIYN